MIKSINSIFSLSFVQTPSAEVALMMPAIWSSIRSFPPSLIPCSYRSSKRQWGKTEYQLPWKISQSQTWWATIQNSTKMWSLTWGLNSNNSSRRSKRSYRCLAFHLLSKTCLTHFTLKVSIKLFRKWSLKTFTMKCSRTEWYQAQLKTLASIISRMVAVQLTMSRIIPSLFRLWPDLLLLAKS